MTQWAEFSTRNRIKLLRGNMTQEQLADASGLSVGTVRKAEQGGNLGIASLLRLASGLGTDVSVILGQQAPRRSMERDERAAVRHISAAVHDSALGITDDVEPGSLPVLRAAVRRADAAFWAGEYIELGSVLGSLLPQARASYGHADGADKEKAAGVLADAYLTAGMAANLLGARDLGYSAITYGRQVADQAGDALRAAHLMAAHSWVCLRDGHTAKAVRLASMAADRVEPRMSDTDPDRLSVYGQLVTNAAVAASRGGASPDTAREYLSQAHAVAARLGREHARGGHGQPYGPVYAITQALSVAIALGETGKAARLIDSTRLDAPALPLATHARWKLDVALTRTETRQWDTAAAELSEVCEMAPRWVRHQALPGVIVGRLADVSVTKVRNLAKAAGVPLGPR
ncbi:helix-turn-helix domain-containing protein [Streptomyces sioyaensis]|uniref:helix-turn-helix domain-containing protein n=1 Tax=Streptomyces sioyaensis TaxID=67364 RepID=UPI003690849F